MLMEILCRIAVRPGSSGNSNRKLDQHKDQQTVSNSEMSNLDIPKPVDLIPRFDLDLELCTFPEAASCAVCSSGRYSEDFADDDGKTRRCVKCPPGSSQGKALAKLRWI